MVQIIKYDKFFENASFKKYFKDRINWKFLNSIIYICTEYEDKIGANIDVSVFVIGNVDEIRKSGPHKIKIYDSIKGYFDVYVPIISANEYYDRNGLYYRITFRDSVKHQKDFENICNRLSSVYKIEMIINSIRTCYIRLL